MGDVLVFITIAAGTFVLVFGGMAFLDKPKQPVKAKLDSKEDVELIGFDPDYLLRADTFKRFMCEKEDLWIAQLEAGIKELNYDLLVLRGEPDITVQNMAAQKMALDAIAKAEECLGMLLKRREATQ